MMDNIKVEIKCDGMKWVKLTQDRFKWRAVVNTVME